MKKQVEKMLSKESKWDFSVIQVRLDRCQAQVAYLEGQRDELILITGSSVVNLVVDVKGMVARTSFQ